MILLGSHGSTPYIQNLRQKQPSCIFNPSWKDNLTKRLSDHKLIGRVSAKAYYFILIKLAWLLNTLIPTHINKMESREKI